MYVHYTEYNYNDFQIKKEYLTILELRARFIYFPICVFIADVRWEVGKFAPNSNDIQLQPILKKKA